MCSCVRSGHPRPPRRNGSQCSVGVLWGPIGVMTHPDRMMSHQSANSVLCLCCVVVARAFDTWNCGVGSMSADSHEMSAPPLEWADGSAQLLQVIFSALISSKLLMEHAFLLSSPPNSALSKHTISSIIFQQLGRFADGQELLGAALLALVRSELSESKSEVTLTSRSPALARASFVSAQDSSASLKSFFMLSASTAGSPCQDSLVTIFAVKLAISYLFVAMSAAWLDMRSSFAFFSIRLFMTFQAC